MRTDETIMQAVANGDLPQLGELYGRYRDQLYGFLVQRTGDAGNAEDLLQATFERILKYRRSYRTGNSFRAWMYAVARNALTDQQKLNGRMLQRNGVDLGQLSSTAIGTTPSVQTEWMDRETRDQGKAALAALSANYREVVDLAWKRGLKYQEIAEVLGITESNVKVRMHRATKQLRENYQKLNH